jgi:hypothetical protein
MSCADCDLTELCRCARARLARVGAAQAPVCVALRGESPIVVASELRHVTNVVLVEAMLRRQTHGAPQRDGRT